MALTSALAGCGDDSSSAGAARGLPSGSSPARMRLERGDLTIVARGLRAAEPSIQREIAASRAAWPTVVRGLPPRTTPATRVSLTNASGAAEAIQTPRFISYAGQLTGSAAAIAGLLLSYEGLSRRGWTLTRAAALAQPPAGAGVSGAASTSGAPATARFLRVNAALYIGCVYDAHYNLSSIGEALQEAYKRLGGAATFGKGLPQAQMEAIAAFYSPTAARLTPKPPPSPAGS